MLKTLFKGSILGFVAVLIIGFLGTRKEVQIQTPWKYTFHWSMVSENTQQMSVPQIDESILLVPATTVSEVAAENKIDFGAIGLLGGVYLAGSIMGALLKKRRLVPIQ